MANLFEAYQKRLSISESVYSKSHSGEKMPHNHKLAVAKCLENVQKFMNESFDSSTGTQRSAMGDFKKFCLNLTTVVLPNLIAHDLVIVHPMSSISGFITYIEYLSGVSKGSTSQGDMFNSPFRLGDVDSNYTSAKVITEAKVAAGAGAYAASLNWYPVVAGTVDVICDTVELVDHAGKLYLKADTTFATEKGTINYTNGDIAVDSGVFTSTKAVNVNYAYDNIVIPQNNIPTLKADMKSIALVAKARRIAVYYSQIAAFQAKTDYGMDLGDQLAEKAVGQLSYEIDTEICNLLIDNAASDAELVWSKTLPIGVSKSDHYQGFSEIVGIAAQKIYDATKRFNPNYMLCASNLIPVIQFIKGFTAAPSGQINGPYFAGTLNGLKIFVTPNITAGKFIVGVNGDDMMSSAAVYAPYMAVVPTQLLQYSDGGTNQGFSTMYDLKMLNTSLLIAGSITA